MNLSSLAVIFDFLNAKGIHPNKREFVIQLASHPASNSLLAVRDTLEYFNCKTEVYRQDLTSLKNLELPFLTLLKTEQEPILCFIQEIKNDQIVIKSSTSREIVNSEYLSQKWSGVILNISNQNKYNLKLAPYYKIFGACLLLTLLLLLPVSKGDYNNSIFILSSMIGLFLSYLAFQANETSSFILSKLCDGTGKLDCSIIKSRKKFIPLFPNIQIPDISIVYFLFQLTIFYLLYTFDNITEYNHIQSNISLITIPIIIISLYYQLKAKKWCLICIGIISILLFQIIFKLDYISYTSSNNYTIFYLYLLTFIIIFIVYNYIKTLYNININLTKNLIPALKVVRDFSTFSKALKTSGKLHLPSEKITLGYENAPLKISCLTNPFCGGCHEVHSALNSLQKKYPDFIRLYIFLKTDFSLETPETILFFKTLYSIYFNNGAEQFTNALNRWYVLNNQKLWFKEFGNTSIDNNSTVYFDSINKWANTNNLIYTPIIFINESIYPEKYDINHLKFFIEDLKHYEFS